MSYKIAVSSSDGIHIDQSFGGTETFYVYEIEGIEHHLVAMRVMELIKENKEKGSSDRNQCGRLDNQCNGKMSRGCGTDGGCGNTEVSIPKVQLVEDCRCVVCKKIGFQVQKQLEKLAITSFDVECTIEEALSKIINYLYKVDGHQSLRGPFL